MSSPWRSLGLGCASLIIGLGDLCMEQTGIFWFALAIGIFICTASIRSMQRGEGKPKKYTDEDVAKAKEELALMYFKEHGSWPKADNKKGDS